MCNGTNGTPNLTGRFLQGWGWDDFYTRNVGEYISEGLPNINGVMYMSGTRDYGFEHGINDSGPFYNAGAIRGRTIGIIEEIGYKMGFNAARCSSVYGNSSTVQPRAYIVYYIMRII